MSPHLHLQIRWLTIAAGVLVLAGLGICAVALLRKPDLSPQIKAAQELGMACRAYARAHGGHFPDALKQLVPEILSEEEFGKLRYFHDTQTGEAFEYLYFADLTLQSDPGLPLLASPGPKGAVRLVVRVDGRGFQMTEKEYGLLEEHYTADQEAGGHTAGAR